MFHKQTGILTENKFGGEATKGLAKQKDFGGLTILCSPKHYSSAKVSLMTPIQ